MGRSRATSGAPGKLTKARIIDAALETIKQEGIVGSSARAIARTGGFNQALIFYHFGSIDEVLLAAVDKVSATRMASYERHLAGVRSLPELVAVGARLYAEDLRDGHITVLAQMLAGSSSSPELSRQLRERFTPWIDLARGAIARAVAGTPFAQVLPVDDLAFAVTSLFMGIELLDHLDDDRARGQAVFGTVELVARLMESLAGSGAPAGDRQTGPP